MSQKIVKCHKCGKKTENWAINETKYFCQRCNSIHRMSQHRRILYGRGRPKRNCIICGAFLSTENKQGFCAFHKEREIALKDKYFRENDARIALNKLNDIILKKMRIEHENQ